MQLTQSIKEIVKRPFWTLLCILVFLTPLVMSNSTNELFEFPKMFLVYFMGIGLFSLLLTSLVLKRSKVYLPSVVITAFLLSNIVSTIFSSHLYTSVWGYYTRFNGGLVSIVVFAAIYFVCKNRLRFDEYVSLMKAGAVTVLPVGVIGIMQHFGWGTEIVDRVYSTFGQPNWLAQYLVMVLPFVLYFFITGFSLLWGSIFIVGFSCLWFTYSMSGIIGFAVVTLVFLGIGIYKKIFSKMAFIKFSAIYLVCFLIAVSSPGLFGGKLADTFKVLNKAEVGPDVTGAVGNNNTPTQPNPHDTGYKVSDPGLIRFGLWQGTLNLFLSSPKVFLIGAGPETFPYAFQPFRPASLNYTSEWDFVFNKPHNYYLEILTETGLLGFLAYVLLLFKLFKKLPFFMLPGVVGFMITNLFGWPVVPTTLLFWLWLSWSESK